MSKTIEEIREFLERCRSKAEAVDVYVKHSGWWHLSKILSVGECIVVAKVGEKLTCILLREIEAVVTKT